MTFTANDDRFKCPCLKCHVTKDSPGLAPSLVEKLNWIERHFKEAGLDANLDPTSGRRCAEHNATLPHAAPDSMHLRGLAVDLATYGKSELAYQIIDGAMICNVPFIEVAPRHVHLDLREIPHPCLIIGPG